MTKKFNYDKGNVGETIAEEYLSKKGYEIIEKNYRSRFGEVDLICASPAASAGRAMLVFVEVKLKTGVDYGNPEEMVNANKIMRIRKMGEFYLLINRKIALKYEQQRIDVIAIVVDRNKVVERITHYENV